jgi:hypothetical protein
LSTPFDTHGRIKVAPGGCHLAHADGTPFFYLADTAWSGALKSSDQDWRAYLADRRAKGFTAIQFILMAPWAACPTDADGRTAYIGDDALGPSEYDINHDFFTRMDDRVQAINDAGLLAVPVLAWAAAFGKSAQFNPGVALPKKFLRELVAYQVARYARHHVLWILAGDGGYSRIRSFKWRRLGQHVFTDGSQHAPVTMHPMGKTWPYSWFAREKWLDIIGYQSSHADDDDTLRWLLTGPPATLWKHIPKPFINLEPCYEGIRNWAQPGEAAFTNAEVRRAMYASLLNAPTAGVTYGAHGVWSWQTQPAEPLNHPGSLVAQPWHQAMQFPGSFDVQRMAGLFTSIDWWRLRPAPQVLAEQPGRSDIRRFVSASASDSDDLALLYLPVGGSVRIATEWGNADAQWFDPRTGQRQVATIAAGEARAPDGGDWVLLLRPVTAKIIEP